MTAVATAVGLVGTAVGTIGSLQNRLQYAIWLAQSQVVNNKAAESRIRDANVAEESANLTRYNILTQSGIAALAQANQPSSAVLAAAVTSSPDRRGGDDPPRRFRAGAPTACPRFHLAELSHH